MVSIVFDVPGLPVAQPRQRHRVVQMGGRAIAANYTPRNDPVQSYKAAVRLAASAAYQGAPIVGPVSLTIRFLFPRNKGQTWKTKPMPRMPKTTKPDIDNIFKAVADALKGLLWFDDAQLSCVLVEKWTCAGDEQPRTEVVVERVDAQKEEARADTPLLR